MMEKVDGKMRADWNNRAKEDAINWVRPSSDPLDFDNSGKEDAARLLSGLTYLPFEKMKLLNIGCGIGRLEPYLAPLFHEVFGVDVSDEMISLGKTRLTSFSNISLQTSNGSDLRIFSDNEFDMVVSYTVFQHLPRSVTANYLQEAFRVLKKQGIFRFQITSLNVPKWFFSLLLKIKHRSLSISAEPEANDTINIRYYKKAELEEMMNKAGFINIHISERRRHVFEKHLFIDGQK
ncbi:MAG: methyltransferase domain-containing protein [Candidatus Bathyarchaeota archaeon]|nr:methyltransferase domain-containing protein [Candidatus Bathyarchaeota archaeon]